MTDTRELAERLLAMYFASQTKVISEFSHDIRGGVRALHAECVQIAEEAGIEPPELDPYYTEDWET